MKRKVKIISALLAFLLFVSSVFSVMIVPSFALTAERSIPAAEVKAETRVYATPQERVANMEFYFSKFGYEIYADPETGEVAYVESANPNNILFTNPYDVGYLYEEEALPKKTYSNLMSQVIISYRENTSQNSNKPLTSYEDAALRSQISVSQIRNGIRVAYTIGDTNRRKIVPDACTTETFEKLIQAPLMAACDEKEARFDNDATEFRFQCERLLAFYLPYGVSVGTPKDVLDNLKAKFPILNDSSVVIYGLDENTSKSDLKKFQDMIKEYCVDYGFDQMDYDYEVIGYKETRKEEPLFKVAIEYTLTEDGLRARVPCNSLQYNMAVYTLESIQILPYLGAGNTRYEGYNFFPDGSGSLFDFDQTVTVSAQIYGLDYAYHQISGATYQKAIRMPVYGSVATEKIHTYTDPETGETKSVSDYQASTEKLQKQGAEVQKTDTYHRGYLAILESGESLGSLTTEQFGSEAPYATLTPSFNPVPKDTYELDITISAAGGSNEINKVSARKYTKDIRILLKLLTDPQQGQTIAQSGNSSYTYYETSWLGMAEAYRDYLVKNETLSKLSNEELTSNIPLYMEVFGAIKTQKTIATVPVKVMTPLTTFSNISAMYQFLASNGVPNVNFKLTGFANGGMYSTVPSGLKWEGKVGGASGFRKLLKEAEKIESENEDAVFGIYPDFDFAYSQKNTFGDDLNLKSDAVKTIDNRYSSKRVYSATRQTYVSFYQLALSPSRYSKFYNKLLKKLGKYDLSTVSLSSLGYALNSDFDEKDPYNREDSKKYTKKALNEFSENYTVMADSGNAYTWAYVDHIVNADIDSSRYSKASCSVPFLGTVLHGYLQFAGPSLNQEGDPNYMILKSVENGAGLYFILSYQNTSELKEDAFLNSYYSIDYDIWKTDLLKYYGILNNLLYDVQSKVIIDHQFLNNDNGYQTIRVLDDDELIAFMEEETQNAAQQAKDAAEQEEIDRRAAVVNAAVAIRNSESVLQDYLEQMQEQNSILQTAYQEMVNAQSKEMLPAKGRGVDSAELPVRVKNFCDKTIDANYTFNRLQYLYEQLNAVYETLPELLNVIGNAVGTDSYRYQSVAEIVNTLMADTSLRESAKALLMYSGEQTYGEAIHSVFTEKVDSLNADIYYKDALPISVEEMILSSAYKPETTDGEDEDEDVVEVPFNAVNNNKVVVVSYGDVNEQRVKTYYKSFILNFNNYAISTVYNGHEYSVPAYGYAVIYHN